MPHHKRKHEPWSNAPFPPSPLAVDKWAAIVRELRLSPQLANVADLVLRDLCDKEIANRLGLSLHTVHTYMERIRLLLGVGSRTGIILRIFAMAEAAAGKSPVPIRSDRIR